MTDRATQSGVAAVLVAAGSGERLAADVPKALVSLGGIPLVRRTAEAILRSGVARRLVVVAPPGRALESIEDALRGLDLEHRVVTGGARRRDSVACGVAAANGDIIVVHDAARPFTSSALFMRVAQVALETGAVVPGLPVADTVVESEDGWAGEVVPRRGLMSVQTPQAFRREILLAAHEGADPGWDAPDDGAMVRRTGHPVAVVPGEPQNVKITYRSDLERAERMLAEKAFSAGGGAMRIGIGWDVHPLVATREFRLLGITLTDAFGPSGHSDGDPLSHAVADALLGAAGMGDVGMAFPDDDPRCRGIAGDTLLTEVVSQLGDAGWRPVQVDAVIVVDRPQIAPRRDEIRARLAKILGVPLDCASIKGKRTEGLGSLADAKGVACHAIARIGRCDA